jgi:cytochrome-b5 reductase
LAKDDLPNSDGTLEAVIRPYTPISTNAQVGSFDLLVKNYGEQGRMSTHLCTMKEGDMISFKHIEFNVKIQAPFPHKKISMLVGGTGITPMVQALHAILGDSASDTEAIMIYGSRESTDILGMDLLNSWIEKSQRFSVHHILSHEPEDSAWTGARGFISKEVLEKHLPPPEDKESIIFICGPPPMYNALCGPRDVKELSGVLHEMGYSADQVFKF